MKTITYKKILITYDGSELASSAIPHATYLAKLLHSEVILLHVINSVEQEIAMTSTASIYPGNMPAINTMEIVKANKVKAANEVSKIRKLLTESGITKVSARVVEGVPGKKIVDIANKEKCDLIIMSTHGRSGLGRALLGSVADYVIRNALCPVLVIHPGPEGGERI